MFALFENLLSSCSGSFPPLSRRQKRLCKKASSDEDSLTFQSIPLASMISVGLDINQHDIIHHNRWFPYNLVRAISVTNGIAGTIQSGKLSLDFKRTITITILNMINDHVQLFVVHHLCQSHQSSCLLQRSQCVVELPAHFWLPMVIMTVMVAIMKKNH